MFMLYSPAEGRVEEFSAVIAVFHLLLRSSHNTADSVSINTTAQVCLHPPAVRGVAGAWRPGHPALATPGEQDT